MELSPRRNIEIKARVASLDGPRAVAAELASQFVGDVQQVDTFFRCSEGRLKLREVDGQPAELIAYSRPDESGPRTSEYYLVPIAQPALCKAALTAALGVQRVVAKRREIYLIDNVRIHLDEVAGLGTFVEMEAVIATEAEGLAAGSMVRKLMEKFGISPNDLMARAYADLLA